MASNFIVSSLPAYVAENKDAILKNIALAGGFTRKRISVQTGVKYQAHLNVLDLDPTLQSGEGCGFTGTGSATLSARTITCPSLKVNMDICPRTLIGKYAEFLVRNNATENELPYEQYIVDGLVAEVNKKVEALMWVGDTAASSDPNKKWFDGFLKIAKNDAGVVDVTIGGTSAYEDILKVYNALPEEVIEKGAEIYVSPAIFRQFTQELVAKNLFHYAGPANEYPNEVLLPGTDCKVVRTFGLAGATEIVGTFAGNLVYGCDLEGDAEEVKIWYSDDDDLFKVKILWNSGVQIAVPQYVVLGATA